MVKALVLFSGGLDSRLVVKLLQEQGVEVECIYFKLPFGCGCCNNLECNFNFLQLNKAKLTIMDCTKSSLFKEYLKVIKNPKFSRGAGMNPCIDCKIFMFKKAKEYADMVNSGVDVDLFQNCPDREFYKNKRILYKQKNKIQIIATGEVLGERPLSQTPSAMKIIDKEIGFELLRPLSAKLLPETKAEKQKLVDRTKFLDIQGRQRKIQLELAKKFNIKFPSPAGGCLLCEKVYANRLKDFFKNEKTITPEKLSTLSNFRHFRSKETNQKILLGRNHQENLMLEQLNKKIKYRLKTSTQKSPGPTAIYESIKDKKLAEQMILVYSGSNLELRKQFDEIRV